MIASSNIYP
nr:unnamed protein product [Callosobruchus chinensis]